MNPRSSVEIESNIDVGVTTKDQQAMLEMTERNMIAECMIVLMQLRAKIDAKLRILAKQNTLLPLLANGMIRNPDSGKREADELLYGVQCEDFWGDFLNDVSERSEYSDARDIGEAGIALSEVIESVLNEVTKKVA